MRGRLSTSHHLCRDGGHTDFIPSLSNSQSIRGAPSAWVDEASRLVSACVACARVDPSITLRAESPETYLDLTIHERQRRPRWNPLRFRQYKTNIVDNKRCCCVHYCT
jgi:hypothetical protein